MTCQSLLNQNLTTATMSRRCQWARKDGYARRTGDQAQPTPTSNSEKLKQLFLSWESWWSIFKGFKGSTLQDWCCCCTQGSCNSHWRLGGRGAHDQAKYARVYFNDLKGCQDLNILLPPFGVGKCQLRKDLAQPSSSRRIEKCQDLKDLLQSLLVELPRFEQLSSYSYQTLTQSGRLELCHDLND